MRNFTKPHIGEFQSSGRVAEFIKIHGIILSVVFQAEDKLMIPINSGFRCQNIELYKTKGCRLKMNLFVRFDFDLHFLSTIM